MSVGFFEQYVSFLIYFQISIVSGQDLVLNSVDCPYKAEKKHNCMDQQCNSHRQFVLRTIARPLL